MGKDIDIKKLSMDELDDETLSELIEGKKSFQIVAVTHLGSVVNAVETAIEKNGLKCRVYTEYRSASLAGMFIPGVQPIGIFSAVGIAAHNLATFDPDYEIAKNKPQGRVTVIYKKI
ncbi:MAG: hypothetical protein U9Q93_14175 [Pseudomonadota bacterium]|nr:hypothetical protein [Pseudomonadota bacterium]